MLRDEEGPCTAEEGFRHVRDKTSEVPQELRCLPSPPSSADGSHLRGVPVVQLRDHMEEFCSLITDSGQSELRFGLGEPHGQPLGLERRKPHGRFGCLRWL
jgi:hypothetical protein